MRTTLALALTLALFVFGMTAAGCTSQKSKGPHSTPEGVVEAFITAFQQKNSEAMGTFYFDRELSSAEQEFLTKLFSVIEVTNFQIEEIVPLSAEEAEVKASITMVVYNREKTAQSIFRVIKKDQRWYLSAHP